MGFSSLADMSRRINPGGRQSNRNSPVKGFTIHHQAGVDSHGEASNPNREVSANYWICNDGTIIPNIDENMRAWTTGAQGFPEGAQSDHRNITAEVSNSPEGVSSGSWAISAAAEKSLSKLIGDVHARHRLGAVVRGKNGGVGVHQDFVSTACPGPYVMGNLGRIIANAEAARTGGTVVTPPTPPTSGKTVWQLADEVMIGAHGNGDARRKSLGSMYDAVQAEVNRRLNMGTPAPGTKSVSQLADEVLAGVHGNGDARKKSLGSRFTEVQNEVNRRLGMGPSTGGPNIAQLADAVMRGDYGNGQVRRIALGANYAAVQAEVDRRLGY